MEEPVKSVNPRARKVASTLLMLRVQRVKLEGPGLHVNSISPQRARKVKRNELRQRELTIVSTFRLVITRPMWMLTHSSVRPHDNCSVKCSVKNN